MPFHEQDRPTYGLYIDGQWRDAASGATMTITDPTRGTPIAEVARAGAADVELAVRAAREAFDHGPWPHTPPAERGRILDLIADKMQEHVDEIAELESRNLGAPLRKTMFVDVPWAIEHLRTFAKLAREFHPYEPLPWIDVPTVSWNFVWREPVGVCGQIIPWNYPLLMAIWKIAPALAAGNTVVLKPASLTPLTALVVTRLIADLDVLPHGVLNVVTGPGGEVGEAIASHPGVDKIAFTGSTEVGRQLMSQGGQMIKRVTLELGGKSPSIVLADADLDLAVDGVLFGIFFNGGQSCEAGTRCFIDRRIYGEFLERLAVRTRQMQLGDPLDLATDMGPLVSHGQLESVEAYVKLGLEEGAKLLTGGKRVRHPEFPNAPFFEPTIFIDVDNRSRLAQEEIFGPVLAVIPFDDIGEAITMSNNSIYGLGGAVWSRNIQLAVEVAKRLRTGTVWINEYHLINPMAPFGGFKQSGIGREHGLAGLRAYTEEKHIHVDLMGKREGRIWWDVVLTDKTEEE